MVSRLPLGDDAAERLGDEGRMCVPPGFPRGKTTRDGSPRREETQSPCPASRGHPSPRARFTRWDAHRFPRACVSLSPGAPLS